MRPTQILSWSDISNWAAASSTVMWLPGPSYSVLTMNLIFGAAVPFTYRRTLLSRKSFLASAPLGMSWTKLVCTPAPTVTGGSVVCARAAAAANTTALAPIVASHRRVMAALGRAPLPTHVTGVVNKVLPSFPVPSGTRPARTDSPGCLDRTHGRHVRATRADRRDALGAGRPRRTHTSPGTGLSCVCGFAVRLLLWSVGV